LNAEETAMPQAKAKAKTKSTAKPASRRGSKAKQTQGKKQQTHNTRQPADRLLQALLTQVPFDGWSQTALKNAANAAGLDEAYVALIWPQGIRDAVRAFSQWATAQMQQRLAAEKLFARMRTRDRVAFAVRTRLEILAPHREAMRQLALWYALPYHAPQAVKQLAALSDTIWQSVGDESTDFNFYSKRALLAGVIKSTTLYWLQDESPDQQQSWDFLDRRIAEVLKLGQFASQLKDWPEQFGRLSQLQDILNFAQKFRRAA
jgi:ubiquinone biosynthesis protein COQ9